MTLFAANTLTIGGPPFGAFTAPLNFIGQLGRGGCAGLLSLLCAAHLKAAMPTEDQAVEGFSVLDGFSIEGIAEMLLQGGLPGLIEFLAAAALFLNAGRGAARLIGLVSFVVIVSAHANGMDHGDLIENAADFFEMMQETLQKFQSTRRL